MEQDDVVRRGKHIFSNNTTKYNYLVLLQKTIVCVRLYDGLCIAYSCEWATLCPWSIWIYTDIYKYIKKKKLYVYWWCRVVQGGIKTRKIRDTNERKPEGNVRVEIYSGPCYWHMHICGRERGGGLDRKWEKRLAETCWCSCDRGLLLTDAPNVRWRPHRHRLLSPGGGRQDDPGKSCLTVRSCRRSVGCCGAASVERTHSRTELLMDVVAEWSMISSIVITIVTTQRSGERGKNKLYER